MNSLSPWYNSTLRGSQAPTVLRPKARHPPLQHTHTLSQNPASSNEPRYTYPSCSRSNSQQKGLRLPFHTATSLLSDDPIRRRSPTTGVSDSSSSLCAIGASGILKYLSMRSTTCGCPACSGKVERSKQHTMTRPGA